MTDAHLYFQPLIVRDSKAKKNIANWVALKDVVAVARRRYASRPVAVEVFYEVSDDDDVSNKSKSTMMRGSSVLFAFRSESAREAVIEALLKNEIDESENETTTLSRFLDPTNVEAISKVTNAWKIGDVSNFEYLMYLNALSGRSFHDVAQYFVFPWILKEYGGENDSNNGFDSDKHSSNSANIDVSDASVYRDYWRVESRAIEILPRANETHGRHAEAKSTLSKTVLIRNPLLCAGLRPLLPPSMRAEAQFKVAKRIFR